MEGSEEILVASVELEPIGTLVTCLVPALPARWSMNNICEQDLCHVSTTKCTLCGWPVHMLNEGECNIDSSNSGQVFFSFLHVLLLRLGVWVDNIALSQRSKFQLKIAWKFSKLPGKIRQRWLIDDKQQSSHLPPRHQAKN